MSELTVHASTCETVPMVQIDDLRAEFSARLKRALSHSGVSEWGAGVRLAEIAGVTPKASSKWLTKESIPSRANMVKIADALGVQVQWLEYGEGPMQSSGSEACGAGAAADIATLFGQVTPKTRSVLERIKRLEREGRLKDEDIATLSAIVELINKRK
ncbi:MAG: helix-turn-helix transcriptional regulator [Gammaproteobacteria bacterium]|nr:helix-turn-helix transcriptional regulator [Gammaproteobacteria bacterium]